LSHVDRSSWWGIDEWKGMDFFSVVTISIAVPPIVTCLLDCFLGFSTRIASAPPTILLTDNNGVVVFARYERRKPLSFKRGGVRFAAHQERLSPVLD